MTALRALAPAKVNLALHVTGQSADGYHLLDSLVVFAGIGDEIALAPSSVLTLSVDGPMAAGVPQDPDNLVFRAAELLRRRRGVTTGASLRLTKYLPHGAGLGGGSSDAATALRLLAGHWQVEPIAPDDPELLALGADLPVCLGAPAPARMRGIGEMVEPFAALPPLGLVLVNPRVVLPTPTVFRGLKSKANPALQPPDAAAQTAEGFAAWLKAQRNDLQAPAEALAPEVGRVLAALFAQPGVLHAVMSGSGATCVGLWPDLDGARAAAAALARARPDWWIEAGAILS